MTTAEAKENQAGTAGDGWICAGRLDDLRSKGCTVVRGDGPGIAVFCTEDRAYAVDNRCPHMGFPLSRGTVQNGILTCHWHHARFDLESGGTFDPFADDVRVYPTRVVDGEVWVNTRPPAEDREAHWKARLEDGLEQNISLVMAKAVLALQESGVPAHEVLAIGGTFGARYRRAGWGPGLTILTAMANVLPRLASEDRMLALFHGMAHVADDVDGQAPWFPLDPLPTRDVPFDRLKAWFRRFVEVRDSEGAERVLMTAIAAESQVASHKSQAAQRAAHSEWRTADSGQRTADSEHASRVADLMLAACTDHYFLAGGHVLDFVNKAFEYVEQAGWNEAPAVLPSLVRGMCMAQRSEELNSWRNPVDLVELLEPIFERLTDGVTRHQSSVVSPDEGRTTKNEQPPPTSSPTSFLSSWGMIRVRRRRRYFVRWKKDGRCRRSGWRSRMRRRCGSRGSIPAMSSGTGSPCCIPSPIAMRCSGAWSARRR